MSTTTRIPREAERPRTLSGSLGVGAIVLMVVAAASPLTVIGGAAPLGVLLGNGVGFPSLYLLSAVVLVLFTVGLSAMSRAIPRPGAFFTYIGHGLGRSAGVAASWLAILTYTSIQACVYGYIGAVLASTVAGLGGPTIPWWLCGLAVVALTGVLGYNHIDLSAKVLGVLLLAEVAIVLVLVVAVVLRGGAEGLSLEPFAPDNVVSGAPGVGLMFAIAAFIGFESTAVFRSEAKDPDRTVPKATYIACAGVGVFYAFASWGLVMAWGPSQAVDTVAADYENVVILTTALYLGPIGQIIMNVLLITSMFACILSFHNVLTRYQHSMASARLLPTALERVHPTHASPHLSSLVQSATAAALVLLFAILGLDPVLHVFTWFAGVATLAIVILMAVTSIAVIVWFRRASAAGRVWNTLVAPVLGFVGLVACAVAIIAYFPLMVGDVDAAGDPVFGGVSIFLLALIAAFALIGVVQAQILKRRYPERYELVISTIAEGA
ncbi:APC family permease [Microbacterium karelineae]|uniref:APC family permease n=1 Tax=Microbacterium karelineae TaxID=2654283 RepID=UPI001E4DC250|nr:APC family permease [Microbacterium karelineae]